MACLLDTYIAIQKAATQSSALRKMGRLSVYSKQRIMLLHSQNFKLSEIVKSLAAENVQVSRQTVSKFIRKSKQSTITVNKPMGPKPKLDLVHLDFFDAKMEENDELCAAGNINTVYIV